MTRKRRRETHLPAASSARSLPASRSAASRCTPLPPDRLPTLTCPARRPEARPALQGPFPHPPLAPSLGSLICHRSSWSSTTPTSRPSPSSPVSSSTVRPTPSRRPRTDLVTSVLSGPVVCMVWEGLDAVKTGRVMLGATNPLASQPGTIRGDYALQVGMNVCASPSRVGTRLRIWADEIQATAPTPSRALRRRLLSGSASACYP